MSFKTKVLVLNASRYQLDNGVHGGKLTWTTLDTTQNENKRGLEVYTASAPFETYGLLESCPAVCELEWSMKATTSNGKAATQVVVLGLKPLQEKKFSSDTGEYTIKG